MELTESAEESGRREVFEETGIVVGELSLVTVLSGEEYYRKLNNKDEYYAVTIVYFTNEIVGGKLQSDGVESFEAKFFYMYEMPTLLTATTSKLLSKITDMQKA